MPKEGTDAPSSECLSGGPSWQCYPPEPEGVALLYTVYLPGYREFLSAGLQPLHCRCYKKYRKDQGLLHIGHVFFTGYKFRDCPEISKDPPEIYVWSPCYPDRGQHLNSGPTD